MAIKSLVHLSKLEEMEEHILSSGKYHKVPVGYPKSGVLKVQTESGRCAVFYKGKGDHIVAPEGLAAKLMLEYAAFARVLKEVDRAGF